MVELLAWQKQEQKGGYPRHMTRPRDKDKLVHSSFRIEQGVPKEASWSVLSSSAENIGQQIDDVCRIIERKNPELDANKYKIQ